MSVKLSSVGQISASRVCDENEVGPMNRKLLLWILLAIAVTVTLYFAMSVAGGEHGTTWPP
jgi:hypothetical protein